MDIPIVIVGAVIGAFFIGLAAYACVRVGADSDLDYYDIALRDGGAEGDGR